MPVLIKTVITFRSGFLRYEEQATETPKLYRLIDCVRTQIKKSDLMQPTCNLHLEMGAVHGRIWHLPEDEAEAKRVLLAYCKSKVASLLENAKELEHRAALDDQRLKELEAELETPNEPSAEG